MEGLSSKCYVVHGTVLCGTVLSSKCYVVHIGGVLVLLEEGKCYWRGVNA